MIERSNRILALDTARKRNITHIQNYVKNTGYLTREETACLDHEKDLFYVVGSHHDELNQLQPLMGGITRIAYKVFGKVIIKDLHGRVRLLNFLAVASL